MDVELSDDMSDSATSTATASSSDSLHTIEDQCGIQTFHAFSYSVKPNNGLIGAAAHGDLQAVRNWIDADCELNNNDNLGNTALHYSAIYNHLDVMEALASQERIRIDVVNFLGESPLHTLIHADSTYSKEFVSLIKTLVEAGCDINKEDNAEHTFLQRLVENLAIPVHIKYEACEYLLEKGACVDIPLSSFCHDLELVHMFLAYGLDVNNAIANYDDYLFNRVLFESIIPYIVDCTLHPLLPYAILHESSWWRYLLTSGADANAYTECNVPCIYIAMRSRNLEVFKAIFECCNHEELLNNHPEFLIVFIETSRLAGSDWLQALYMILEHECAEDFVHLSFPRGVYNSLLRQSHLINKDMDKIIYTILTFDNRVSTAEVLAVYRAYGLGAEFEAFLRVGVYMYDLDSYPPLEIDLVEALCRPLTIHNSAANRVARSLFETSVLRIRRLLLSSCPGNAHLRHYGTVLKLPILECLKTVLLYHKF